jgi:ParB family chromosome partitioning protein
MREKGMTDDEIAVAFFTTVQVVKQRLRLTSVSPKLCDVQAEDGMTLGQLMALSVTGDHARQEQVWDSVSRSGFDEPYQIRRMLTENTVRASDRRVLFVGPRPTSRPVVPSCAICSRTMMAAGCRTRRCSTGSSPTS